MARTDTFDLNNFEGEPQLLNQLKLIESDGNFPYISKYISYLDVEDVRLLRKFFKTASISNIMKQEFLGLLHNLKYIKNLSNIDSTRINDDNLDACVYCIENDFYTDELYNYDMTGDSLSLKIQCLHNGIDIDKYSYVDYDIMCSLLTMKTDGYDVSKLEKLQKDKLVCVVNYIDNNDVYCDEFLDDRTNSNNIALVDICVQEYNIPAECVFKKSEAQCSELLYLYKTEDVDISEFLMLDYDDTLFEHILKLRENDLSYSEEKLIEFETHCASIEKRNQIFGLISFDVFSEDEIEYLIDNYEILKDRLGLIENIIYYDCDLPIDKTTGRFTLLNPDFTIDQLDIINNLVTYDNFECLYYINPKMSEYAIRNVFELYNENQDLENITDFEIDSRTIKMFKYLDSNNIPYDKTDPADYEKKFIEESNRDCLGLCRLIKSGKISYTNKQLEKIEYILKYNETNKPVSILEYEQYDLDKIKSLLPIKCEEKIR